MELPTTASAERTARAARPDAELVSIFDAQREAFRKNPYPPYAERIELLKALEAMLKRHRRNAEEALASDFRTHPPQLTALCELMGPIERARFARAHLKAWMRPQPRPASLTLYGLSKTYVMYQPKGVVGNLSPWNFPIDISVGPLADILAAGNRAILKPSELAPASAELVKEMVSHTFDRDRAAVVTGGVELARAFAAMPWDHLLYTGGPSVAKLVMRAAAENLTPVTLELGGKCPAILAPDSVDAATAANVLAAKFIKNGQMCVNVDYVLVPADRRDAFVSLANDAVARMLPSYATNPQSTGIIDDRNLDRLLSYLDDATKKGARVVPLGGGDVSVHRAERKMPLSLVLDPRDDMEVMRNEIFGPILPVVTYRSIEEAIEYVNARPRPLALYVYTKDAARADDVLRRTISGGACVNAAAIHATVPSLPFGGIGNSGMGRHHGFEGFLTFSHEKAVFRSGLGYVPSIVYPPYGKKLDRVLSWLLR
ncbi:MAG TPA: coniferyl aldehyde dehydrogenase [Anaeromyxobacter sp.]|nr:coniferyl aldehyde dehydrogenase [Anaeromyxobacter sp.]